MNYFPLTEQDRSTMLQEIGADSFEDLLEMIPRELRLKELAMPPGTSELELAREMQELASTNRTSPGMLSFLGAGCYEHFIPSIVSHILSRSEFYTAYTPYQAEASQGTLQTIFEYQSMMAELTGMDLSNASNYDGASATAEAALLSLRHTGRNRVLVARSLHPEYRATIRTYLFGLHAEVLEIPFDAQGNLDQNFLDQHLDDKVASVIVQSPNFFGLVENDEGIAKKVHASGALFIMAVNPLSLGLFKSPGEWGADIAVGEGQSLGVPMTMGGPALGFFAVKRDLIRRIPGRLVGMTTDRNGKRCFTLTLQAREQHIRREKAGSNICTNQALLALAACVYLSAMGKTGIRKVAEFNVQSAIYLRDRLSKLKGFGLAFSGSIFNEFVLRCQKYAPADVNKKLAGQNIFAGVELAKFYSELKDGLLICATETKTKAELDRFVESVQKL